MMSDFLFFSFWSLVWIVLLVLPPGSKEIMTAYRINFCHGLISSVLAFVCMNGGVKEDFTCMVTISYFFVDFCNNLLNDYYYKVKSYQPPTARKIEYAHHIFCFIVGLTCHYKYRSYCELETNPFINLMLAEVSTPLLIAWRHYPNNILGGLFAITFIVFRIIYHGFIFIPHCISVCHKPVSYTFAVLYNGMNAYFIYMIVNKIIRNIGKKK